MGFSLPFAVTCLTLLSLPLLTAAQSYKNITLGSSLAAGDSPSSSWASPSGDFAFGFQEVAPGYFLLAIWFDKIPEKTITWSANRDRLAPKGSKVALTNDRGLVLDDPSGHEIWRARLAGSGSGRLAHGALLDTGNLVLAAEPSAILWQSFDEPTDTLLPSQTLGLGGQLIARYTGTNYSSGRFLLQLGTDGNLAFYTTNFPLSSSLNSYYLTWGTQGSGYQVVFNQSGSLYLVVKNNTIIDDVLSDSVSGRLFYQRAILEYDGVLRHYVYPKPQPSPSSLGSAGWSTKSSFPENICLDVLQETGSGVCGFNSYCQLGNDKRPYCLCLPGYSLRDPDNGMSGCFQNFLPQSCEDGSDEQNFDLKVLHDVDWPLSDYEHYKNVTKDWCSEACLEDCLCAVGIFREGGDCWKKRLPLSNGKNDSSVGRTAFIKVRTKGNFTATQGRTSRRKWAVLLGLSGSVNVFFLGVGLLCVYLVLHREKHEKNTKGGDVDGLYGTIRSFGYKELSEATNGFKEEIGRGAFGVVYKGFLDSQIAIAVKNLDSVLQDSDKEFKTEVNAIGRTNHKNLVRLIGFCDEDKHRLLVYEFLSNGTLSEFLHRAPRPAWERRCKIARGIARGLFYLHEECSAQVIHCDIKPQNILLDDHYNPRISDFGLAKLLRFDQTQTNTVARGTRGYVAPEWFRNVPISVKVDVYSFGILLLEIVCCRRNVYVGDDCEEEGLVLLTDKAFDCCQEERISALVQDDMEALGDMATLERMVKLALWCVQDDPTARPSMRMAVQMLEGLVLVPEPPSQAVYSSSITS